MLLFSSPALLALLLAFAPPQGQPQVEVATEEPATPLLAFYDFEETTPSGPDTFRLFERPGGGVDLSRAFRVSGSRSLRLREGADDGSFSEFLGFFPERRGGLVFAQFYILFTDPAETFNFALAGPRWFLRFEKDGHAVWIATHDGVLVHRPAGSWRTLLVPSPFVWYFLDLVYDVDAGTYDLAIYEEGDQEPFIDLRRQRNTANADSSSVAYYSFIGDLQDRDEARFFVDDLLLATDPEVRLKPFVAPGRRELFVESYAALAPRPSRREAEQLIWEARAFLRRHPEPAETPLLELGHRLEQAADEAFLAGDLDLAEELYLRLGACSSNQTPRTVGGTEPQRDERRSTACGALAADPQRQVRLLLKMADIHFLRGEHEAEQHKRETIYGRLELEERRISD